MINPIEHVRAIYRSKQPARQVKILRFTNYDFMKSESPFAQGTKPKLSFLQKAKLYVKNKWQNVKQYIENKKANAECRKEPAKDKTCDPIDLHSVFYD